MLIYGANGYTGELIAHEAARRGLAPVLAGRDEAAVATLARSLALPWRAFALSDPQAVAQGIAGAGTVLHCAGPFVRTSRAMVDACLAAGQSYLDITGEIPVFEAVLARDAEAKQAGVVLLPGIGFDVVPTDCLALQLKELLPDATHLDLAFVSEGGGWSPGTLATMIESLPHAGAMRRNGRIMPLPLAAEVLEIDLPVGRRTVMSIAWGDIATAYRTTGIANIRTFTGVPARTVRRLRRLRPLLPLAGWKPVKRLLERWVRRSVTGPNATQRLEGRTWIWGTVRNSAGASVTHCFATAEGYALTARTAVEGLLRVENGALAPGAWTPARAFGARFIADFDTGSDPEVEPSIVSGATPPA
ncbi:MAG: saccharopine dehydrogenase NADP-binding domain-containing protein [Thermoanaerobaculia bacterium]